MSQDRNYRNNRHYHKYNPYSIEKRYEQNLRTNNQFNLKNYNILNESKAEINVYPFSCYNFDFPDFNKPVEIGILLSEKRKKEIESKKHKNPVEYDKAKGLKFLALPTNYDDCNFDLKIGIEKFVEHIPHQHGIDTLLQWLLENREKLLQKDKSLQSIKPIDSDFICWRGLLTTIAITPYEKMNDWMFSIILYKGTYYLCEIETELNEKKRLNMDERSKQFSFWGHKFESYITANLPNTEPFGKDDVPDPENNCSTIVKTKFGLHSLTYGAEIDCCIQNEHKELNDYCELKTARGNSIEDLNFAKHIKFLKWWIQSFLVNIELIKVGLRDDNGFVKKIVDCKMFDINKQSKEKVYYKFKPNKMIKSFNKIALILNQKWWKENVCFNFLKTVLDTIKEFCVEEKSLYIVYREEKSNQVKLYKVNKESDEFNKKYFLRDWYTSLI